MPITRWLGPLRTAKEAIPCWFSPLLRVPLYYFPPAAGDW